MNLIRTVTWCAHNIVFNVQMIEAEVMRLSHLRDRASDLGRKKEYPLFIKCLRFHIKLCYQMFTTSYYSMAAFLCF